MMKIVVGDGYLLGEALSQAKERIKAEGIPDERIISVSHVYEAGSYGKPMSMTKPWTVVIAIREN